MAQYFILDTLVRGALAIAAFTSASVSAQETRIGEEGFESPQASLAQMDWLVGQWSGDGIGGNPAMESWLPPTGSVMVGTFLQQGEDGEIQFTEHLYLMEEEGTLVLRLKHFNADLTGWEEKDDFLTFPFREQGENFIQFGGLRFDRVDDNAMRISLRMKTRDGEHTEVFNMRRPGE